MGLQRQDCEPRMIEITVVAAVLAVAAAVCFATIWTLWLLLDETREDLAAADAQNQRLEARCNALIAENHEQTQRTRRR